METCIETSKSYHERTCHIRSRMDGVGLDWSDQPDVFKRYPDAENVQLTPVAELCRKNLGAIVSQNVDETGSYRLDHETLSEIIAMGNGITLERVHGGMSYLFRSAASAGALYPVEMYVDIRHVQGFEPGLYHVNIRDFSLERLRIHTPAEEAVEPFARIFLTGIFYRSAWKYRKRAYRYILNDLGHVAANILLVSLGRGVKARLCYDFPDEAVNRYLGLDPAREVCLAFVDLGIAKRPDDLFIPGFFDGTNDLAAYQSTPVSKRDVSYPEILGIHQAGKMSSPVGSIGKNMDYDGLIHRVSRWETIPEKSLDLMVKGLGEAILYRRSRRNFIDDPLKSGHAMALVGLVARTWRMIKNHLGIHPGYMPGFLCNRHESVRPGYYLIDAEKNRYGLVEEGAFTPSMTGACLDQNWLKMAGFHFLMISYLSSVDDAMGPRGYRHAMINAGLLGQTVYLGSVSLGLGCCGIGAFYDDEAAGVLDLDDHEYLLYLVAVGRVKMGV